MAKAWVNFNGQGTVSIRDDFNVDTIGDNGVGDYSINFSSPMTNNHYAVAGLSQYDTSNVDANVPSLGIRRANNSLAYNENFFRVCSIISTATSISPYDCFRITLCVF